MDKNEITIKGVLYSPVKKIDLDNGDLFHIIRNFDEGFSGFGEAYISTINPNEIKAWKRHFQMTANMVVPQGRVKMIIFDDEHYITIILNFKYILLLTTQYSDDTKSFQPKKSFFVRISTIKLIQKSRIPS